jgi:hypothetical protein
MPARALVVFVLLASWACCSSEPLPSVTVTVAYPDADVWLVETQVIVPVENAVRELPGVDSINSTAREEQATITVVFGQAVDLEPVMNWRGVFAPEVPLGGMHSHREAQPPIGMQLQGRSEPSRESARDCNTRRVQPSRRPAFAALSS